MKRSSLWCLALVTPLAAGACGSDDGGDEASGEHYRYVVSKVDTASTNTMDVDGNGRKENKLGELLAGLSTQFQVQPTVDESVARGTALLLIDLQTSSFSSAAAAGFSLYLGDTATASPAPCTDNNTLSTCGQHLKGTGSFSISAASPRDAQLTGPIAGGTLNAGPGTVSLSLALGGPPATVKLVGARVQLSGASDAGIETGVIGGGITQTELDSVVLPAVAAQMKVVIDRDCGPEAQRTLSGNVCGYTPVGGSFTACAAGTTGETLLNPTSGFDSTRDCKITVAEIKAHPLLGLALTPDITLNGQAAVSAVLGFKATKGTFTP